MPASRITLPHFAMSAWMIAANSSGVFAIHSGNPAAISQAAAVTAYLASVGISADRLDAAGIGSAKAIAPNLTQRGREQNRRVEIVIR